MNNWMLMYLKFLHENLQILEKQNKSDIERNRKFGKY